MYRPLFEASYTLNEIADVAEKLAQLIIEYRICTLDGDMGAGKTTLVSFICDHLEVSDSVSSPTFSIINEYGYLDNGTEKPLWHIDLYRLSGTEEAINAGVESCINDAAVGRGLCIVEWPERAPQLFDLPHLSVSIAVTSETSRHLTARPVNSRQSEEFHI